MTPHLIQLGAFSDLSASVSTRHLVQAGNVLYSYNSATTSWEPVYGGTVSTFTTNDLTLSENDAVIIVNSDSSGTITLPSASSANVGMRKTIKRLESYSTTSIDINVASNGSIDSSYSTSIGPAAKVDFVSTGTLWREL